MDVVGVVLFVVYVGGLWRFWTKFKLTNYRVTLPFRLVLSLLWPALLIASKSYRRNFRKTLRGH